MKTISERIAELPPEKRELFTLLLGKKAPDPSGQTVTAGRRGNGPLPLSFAQQRFWFLDQLNPVTALYNLPKAVRLHGVLNLSALTRSFAELVRRHETLRTTFHVVDEQPAQVVSPAPAPGLPFFDLSHLEVAEREAEVARLAEEEARLPFDLALGPLLRLRVLRLAEEDHVLLLTMHHIVSDAWSMAVLIKEVITLYSAYSQGQPSPLPDLPVQYADYAIWQREYLTGELLEQQVDYWRKQLKGVAALELPRDRPRRSGRSYRVASAGFKLTEELTQSLRKLSERAGATLYMTLLAAFQTLLHRYTNQRDISVGTPIANRNRAEIEGLIGFLVNTLVMRTDFSGDPMFSQLLGRVRETALDAYANQDVPFERLVEELQPERDLSHSPLFQVLFTLQNAPPAKVELPGFELNVFERQIQFTTFDLNLVVEESDEGVGGLLAGSLDLFEPERVHRFVEHYEVLLKTIVADPEQKISQLQILSDAERQRLLVEWNETEREYAPAPTLSELFEAQAEQSGEALAVVFEGEQLTYAELDRRANQLAHYLVAQGVKVDDIVGVLMERSVDMVVSLLGILKAGAAYLPLDPGYPPERLSFMLADAHLRWLISHKAVATMLPALRSETPPINVLLLDAEWATVAAQPATVAGVRSAPDNLAYVLYTSGSTGQPKGVMISHRAICNHMLWMHEHFPLAATDAVLQKTPFSFDASMWEFYAPLLAGARLVMAQPGGHQDAAYLVEVMEREGVTRFQGVPTLLRMLVSEGGLERCTQLREVFSGGEVLGWELAESVLRAHSEVKLFNLYGPTEATIDAMWQEAERGRVRAGEDVGIGRPIANTQVYVLDAAMQVAPAGVVGELYIGGEGLARGYLDRAELTAERFVPHPYSTQAGERLYRTGDMVRWREQGELEFSGRVDGQVKIRGFRIELGEVEAALCAQTGVHNAVVAAKERDDDDKQLVAYVVTNSNGDEVDAGKLVASLKAALGQMLPAYMVPQAFMVLDELPLTPSGKIDYRRLPAPGQGRPTLSSEYVAPRSAFEQVLARIWAELLHVERVGLNDNFFDLGGHSLLVTRLIARLRSVLSIELPLRSVFENPTLVGLSEIVLQQAGQRARIEKTAELLLELEQLSEGEAGRMLEEVTVPTAEREAR